jgi:hypothetical protein
VFIVHRLSLTCKALRNAQIAGVNLRDVTQRVHAFEMVFDGAGETRIFRCMPRISTREIPSYRFFGVSRIETIISRKGNGKIIVRNFTRSDRLSKFEYTSVRRYRRPLTFTSLDFFMNTIGAVSSDDPRSAIFGETVFRRWGENAYVHLCEVRKRIGRTITTEYRKKREKSVRDRIIPQ